MTTKILALTDALGNLVRFRLVPGNHYDSVDVPPLIEGIAFDGIVARRHSFKPARIAFGAAERRPIAHPPIGDAGDVSIYSEFGDLPCENPSRIDGQ